MTSEEIKTNNYISLTEAAEKYTNYSQEYLSLRARQGKLKAVKIGRNWLTKKEWVEEYITMFNGNGETNAHALSDTKSSIKTIANGLRQKKSTAAGPKLFSLGELENYSGYSQEYLSLRARQGKLKAVKIGRNWLMAKEWIDEYKNNVNGNYSAVSVIKDVWENLASQPQKISQAVSYFSQLLKKQSAVLLAAAVLIFCSAGLVLGFPYIDDLHQAVKKTAFEILRPLGLRMTAVSFSITDEALFRMTQLKFVILSEAKDLGFRMTQARDEANVASNEFVSFLSEQKFTLFFLANSFFQKEKQFAYADLIDAISAVENIENYIERKVKDVAFSGEILRPLGLRMTELKVVILSEAKDLSYSMAEEASFRTTQIAIIQKEFKEGIDFTGKLFRQSFFVLQDVVGLEVRNRQHELEKTFQESKSTRSVALVSRVKRALSSSEGFAKGLIESTKEILWPLGFRMTEASLNITEEASFRIAIIQKEFKEGIVHEFYNQLSIFNDKNRIVNKLFNQAAVDCQRFLANARNDISLGFSAWSQQLNAAGNSAVTFIDGWQASIENKAGDYWATGQDNWQYNWRAVIVMVNQQGDKLANNIENFSANLLENVQQGMAWLMIGSTNNAEEFSLTFFQKIKFFTSLTSQSLRATSQIAWDSAQTSGNAIGDKIVEGIGNAVGSLRSLTYSIYNRTSEGLAKGYEFITRPWRERATQQLAKTTINQAAAPAIQIISTTTSSTSSAEEMIAQLTPKELTPKELTPEEIINEIIKEGALSQTAAINTIREIVRIDESSLVLIRSQIAKLQEDAANAAIVGDIKKLQDLLVKIQSAPPIYSVASAAPAYIGSTGLQVSGGANLNSLGASGLVGINELSVGGSVILGQTAGNLLTVNASAGFLADVSFSKNVNILGSLTSSGALNFGTARGGAITIVSTSSPQLTVAYNGSHYFNLDVASTGSSTLASTGALNLTGNGNSVWQTVSSPLTIKTNTTGDILLSSAGNFTEKFATSSAYTLYQGETVRLAINTAGNISLVASSTIDLTGKTTITGNTTIAGNTTTTGNTIVLGNLMVSGIFNVSGTSTLTTTSANQLTVAGNTYFSGLTVGSVPFIGAGGLLSQDNSNLFWDSATARLGIGTSSPVAKLTVEGDVYIMGNTTTTGNIFVGASSVVFGTSSSSNLIVNSAVASNLIPDQNAVRSLGSAAYFWDNLYIDAIVANNLSVASTSIGGTNSNDFVINSDNGTADTETENLIFFRGTVVPNALLTWDATADRFDFNQPIFTQNDSSTTTVVSLDVRGKAGQIADLFRVASSSEESFFNITTNGYVGIGTTTPYTKLDVWGSLQVGTSTTPTLTPLFIANTGSGTVGIGTSTSLAKFAIAGTAGVTALNIASSTGSSMLMVDQYGNVGIGTSTPYTKLDVYGSFQVGTSTTPTLTPLFIANTGTATVGIGTSTPSAKFSIAGVAGADNLSVASSTGAIDFIVDRYGDVGIGTSSPSAKLAIAGLSGWNSLNIASTTGVSMLSVDRYGNVGVGKSSASRKLEIFDATNPQLRLSQASGSKYSEFQTNSLGDLIIASNLGQLFKTDSNDYSVVIGQDSGVNLADTAGQFNTALGWQSLYTATSSDYNTAIGFWSLYNNAGGERNTALGANVLYSNVSGSINVAIGDNALYNNTTASHNTALGPNTLLWNQTGEANTVIGSSAGGANFGSVVNSSFSSSTIIGVKAGYSLGSGSKNILIGYQAGDSLTTGESNIIIGYDQDALAAGTSNFLNIGGLVYGDLSAAKVGIGTTTPYTKLDVWGSFQVGTSTTPTLTPLFIVNTGSGTVGIGTSTSLAKFAIAGVAGVDSLNIASSTGASMLMVDQYGNVGIGTSSPAAKFAVEGNTFLLGNTTTTGNLYVAGLVTMTSGFDSNAASTASSLTLDANTGNALTISGTSFTTDITLQNGETIDNDTNGTILLTADTSKTSGNLYVGSSGTGTITSGLINSQTISSTANFTGTVAAATSLTVPIVYGGTAAGSTLTLAGTSNGAPSNAYIILNGSGQGNVGIGTTTPYTKLDVWGSLQVGTSTTPTLTPLFIANTGTATVGIGTSTPFAKFSIAGVAGVNALQISSSTGATDFMVGQYGNVGIGTSTPSARLDLLGRAGWASLHIASSTGANMMSIDGYGLLSFGLPDNQATAMTVSEGTTPYLTFDTTDSAEKIVVGKNLEVGTMEVDADSGAVNFVNMDISTTTATSTVESLSISLSDISILTVYGEATGNGLVQNRRVGIGTTSPIAMLEVRGNASTSGPLLRITTSTTEALYVDALGYVGIGTTTPTAKFSIAGVAGVNALQISSSTGATDLMLDQYGNVGIGTSTPSARLDLLGRAGWASLHIASSTGANMMSIDGYGLLSFGLPDNQATAMTVSEGSNTYLTFDTTDSAEKIVVGKDFEIGLMNVIADSGEVDFVNMTVSTTTATNTVESLSIAIDDNSILTVYGEADGQGNLINYRVGIGTTSPAAMLAIQGNASTSGPLLRITTSTTEALFVDATGNVGIGTASPSRKLSIVDANNPQLRLTYTANSIYADLQATANGYLSLAPTGGRVGIGTTTPGAALDIFSTSTVQLRLSTSTGYANFYVDNNGYLNVETQYSTTSALQITNSNIVANQPMQFNSPGDVGFSYDLSMENPAAAYIRFAGAGYVQTESPFGNYNLTLSAANAGKVVINDDLQTTGQTNFVATTTQNLATTTAIQVGGATHIVIEATSTITLTATPTIADGVTGDIIIIRSATSNPITLQDQDTPGADATNLQLGSTVRALTNGSTIALMFDGTDWMELWWSGASHADYAEMYKTKEDVSFGEVVSVDKDNYLQVGKAVLGDIDVAGIISARPAYLIGQEFRDEMQMPVALAGRVPVKISLEAGAIKKGDVLIPSTKPGYAMKYNEKYLLEISTSSLDLSNIPIVGVALEDYGTFSIAGEFLETTYKTYKVKFISGSSSADINRLNGKYKVKVLPPSVTLSSAKGLEQTIEIRAEYEQSYLQSPIIESSQWLSDNIIRKPNPEFRSTDNSDETVLCMVKSGFVKVGPAGGFSKLTVVEKDGQLAFEPEDKNFAEALDMAIEADGSLVVGKLKAKQAEIGSAEKPAGITLYDEDTGTPYCLKMKAGAMISEAGKCGDLAPAPSSPPIPPISPLTPISPISPLTPEPSLDPEPLLTPSINSATSTTSTEPLPSPDIETPNIDILTSPQ